MNAMSDTIGQLTAALAKAQGAMGAAMIDGSAKIATKTGSSYGYTYASLTSVWNAVRKPLSDNGLAIIQRIDDESGVMFLHTILSHESGEYITSRLAIGQVGKPAQETGSAITYARRYALSALVGVVTDEDDDGEAATKAQRERPQPVKPTQPAQPANAQDGYEPEPGEEVWADWKRPEHAQAWAMTQGKFDHQKHMANAYAKVKADCQPQNAREMWRCWWEYVMAHEPAKAQEATTDGPWADVDAHGHDADEPQFS